MNWKSAGWVTTGEKKSGGQGEAWPVIRSEESAFLKLLKSQNDSERRVRMYREAVALSTYKHPGIPAFIESNCHHYQNKDYKLYLVTELVQGPTLREYIEDYGPMNFEHAVAITDRLLDVVEYYHSSDGIHRDIKPDNIILRGGEPADAVLVDFGLAWQPQDQDSYATDDGQELGNRFLRLNELAPDSPNKRDPRSDITFVVGILFYVLTGKNPSVLEDSDTGRRPHQREEIPERLRDATNSRALPMFTLFDRGFSPLLSRRFQSAQELKQELNRMKDNDSTQTEEDVLLEIKNRLEAQGAGQNENYLSIINNAVNAICSTRDDMIEIMGGYLLPVRTGFYKNEPRHSWLNIGFDTPGTSYPRFRPTFDFTIIGEEFIVSTFKEQREGAAHVIWRTDVTNVDFGKDFHNEIKKVFTLGLKNVFS
ncbi:serine/threonine protein kinase [Aeromonas sp. 80P]